MLAKAAKADDGKNAAQRSSVERRSDQQGQGNGHEGQQAHVQVNALAIQEVVVRDQAAGMPQHPLVLRLEPILRTAQQSKDSQPRAERVHQHGKGKIVPFTPMQRPFIVQSQIARNGHEEHGQYAACKTRVIQIVSAMHACGCGGNDRHGKTYGNTRRQRCQYMPP
ncbi:hypothetical protein SDC9_186224 [bioreactor metagenome]|uniref:Uncharacterized protein n=1 Tax=bioreactor metagenome TaxID=1076179 RepID=A0A645HKI4_9ZZZZ